MTGRESTRLDPRHQVRPARVDREGHESTVDALRRAQWQSPISDAARAVRENDSGRSRAVLPTDDGRPIMSPNRRSPGEGSGGMLGEGPGHLSTLSG